MRAKVILTVRKLKEYPLCYGTVLSYTEKLPGDKECVEKYGHGTPDDWVERNIYSKHTVWGVSSMLVINFCLFG